ncbi:hypothetical protein NDU88_003130 [Pleurodeles waltl]|uniref:Uncharacterized protein n=1 Tax=Pleurodeles waltl TaxID=8319 RepID=A0AAV7WS71_PLEWA|nr:hypothetical protein NDU88_003130 [Pleurodeles waltl]
MLRSGTGFLGVCPSASGAAHLPGSVPGSSGCPARPHSITAVPGLRKREQAAAVSCPHLLQMRLSGAPGRVPGSPQCRLLLAYGGSTDGPEVGVFSLDNSWAPPELEI